MEIKMKKVLFILALPLLIGAGQPKDIQEKAVKNTGNIISFAGFAALAYQVKKIFGYAKSVYGEYKEVHDFNKEQLDVLKQYIGDRVKADKNYWCLDDPFLRFPKQDLFSEGPGEFKPLAHATAVSKINPILKMPYFINQKCLKLGFNAFKKQKGIAELILPAAAICIGQIAQAKIR
jgi:hypothetical protein